MKLYVLILSILPCLLGTANNGPHILWITYEDTSPQFIGCYGNSNVHTPVIDQLAREGVMFTNAFSTATVCAPSRFTLITGCSAETYGTGNHRSTVPIPDSIKGFPYYLRQAGYYCSNNFKTDYNTANAKWIIKNAWNESSKNAGWHKRETDQSFFAVVNYMTSHQSRTMTNPYTWYQQMILNKLPEDKITHADSIEVPPFFNDTPEMRKHLNRVYNALNLTDIEIGLLLDSLKAQGLMDETIIFCFADHGEAIPRGKTNSIGLGHRVPFIIWFPEKYRSLSPWTLGEPCDELVSFVDLAPTVLSLAGVEIPSYMQGRALLGSQRSESNAFVYGSRNAIDETPGLSRSVTNGEYFYTRVYLPRYPVLRYQKYADVSDIVKTIRADYLAENLNVAQQELLTQRPMEYLFNLKTDKWEQNNLATDPAFDSLLTIFRAENEQHILRTNDAHFLPAYELDQIADTMAISEFCHNTNLYPLKQLMEVAGSIGNQKNALQNQLDWLNHSNNLVCYYALAGLSLQTHLPESAQRQISALLNHRYPLIQIEAAAILYLKRKDKKAKEVLEKYALDDNPFLALAALQQIQYMDELSIDFTTTLQKVLARYDEKARQKTEIYHLVSTAEVTLYIHSKHDNLYYDDMKPWLNPTLK